MAWTKEAEHVLIEGTKTLGLQVELDLESFKTLYQELVKANQTTNLTAIRDEKGIITRHFLDSLTCLLADSMEGPKHLIDIGSGPGFPGLPIKLARPELQVTLLEASQKKANFIEHVIKTLNLGQTQAIWGRAEDLAHQPYLREQFDLVTARALSSLATVCELGLPFLKLGGKLIAMKGPEVAQESSAGESAASILGGQICQTITFDLPQQAGPRTLIVVQKVESTPTQYPRRAGVPERKPLG